MDYDFGGVDDDLSVQKHPHITAKTFTLISPLRRDEIVRQLHDNIDRPWNIFGKKSVIGSVDRASFRLCRRLNFRNSFTTHLSGKLIDERDSTRIRCKAGMHPIVIAVLTVWFGALTLIAAFTTLSLWSEQPSSPFALIPLLLLFAGMALVWFGRWLSRNDTQTLVDFLEATIDAELVD